MNARTKISGLLAALWIALLLWPASAFAAEELADGTYTADYLILKAENDSVSMANDYWEKPATVTIKDGKATVRVTINHSFWVTQFKVPGGGGYVDTKIISSNKKADTRLVEFAADVKKPIISKIHVTVEEIDYDHDYTIRFVFDLDSFKLVKGAAPAATATPKPTEQPATAPTTKPAATAEPTQGGQQGGGETGAAGGSATSGTTAGEASAPAQPTATPKASESAEDEPSATTTASAGAAEGSAEPSASAATGQQGGGDSGESGGTASDQEAVDEGSAESTSGGEVQVADADAAGGDSVTAMAAGEVTEASVKESGGSGLIWWTPIAAVLILAAGAVYIWRRKVRQV